MSNLDKHQFVQKVEYKGKLKEKREEGQSPAPSEDSGERKEIKEGDKEKVRGK